MGCVGATHPGDVAQELPVDVGEVQGHVSSCLSFQQAVLLGKCEALLDCGQFLYGSKEGQGRGMKVTGAYRECIKDRGNNVAS